MSVRYDFSSGLGIAMNWSELDTENDQTGDDLEFNPERQISTTLSYTSAHYHVWIMGKIHRRTIC